MTQEQKECVENGLANLKKVPVKKAISFEPEGIIGSKSDVKLSDEQKKAASAGTEKVYLKKQFPLWAIALVGFIVGAIVEKICTLIR